MPLHPKHMHIDAEPIFFILTRETEYDLAKAVTANLY